MAMSTNLAERVRHLQTPAEQLALAQRQARASLAEHGLVAAQRLERAQAEHVHVEVDAAVR